MQQSINKMGETINHLAADETEIVAKHFLTIRTKRPDHDSIRFIDRIYFAARQGSLMLSDKEFTWADKLLQQHGLADLNYVVNHSAEGLLRQELGEEPFHIEAVLGPVAVTEDVQAKAAAMLSGLKRVLRQDGAR